MNVTRVLKPYSKRVFSFLLAVILVFNLFGWTQTPVPKAHANALVEAMSEFDIRTMIEIINEYAKAAALEAKITVGAYSGAALASAEATLASVEAGAAATGVTAATAATFATALALAGIVVITVDWDAYWDETFSPDKFQANYKYTNNSITNWTTNYTHIDEWVTSYINATGIAEKAGYAPWEWEYVEMTKQGWQSIYDWAVGIFGTENGEQALPAVPLIESLEYLNLKYNGVFYWGNDKNYPAHVYSLPIGFTYCDKYGQVYTSYVNNYGRSCIAKEGWLNRDNNWFKSVDDIHAWDYYPVLVVHERPMNSFFGAWANSPVFSEDVVALLGCSGTNLGVANVSGGCVWLTADALGLPAVQYNSKIETIAQNFPDSIPVDEPKIIELPHDFPEEMPDTQKYYEYVKQLPYIFPDAVPDTGTEPKTDTGTDPDTPAEPTLAEIMAQIDALQGRVDELSNEIDGLRNDIAVLYEKMESIMEAEETETGVAGEDEEIDEEAEEARAKGEPRAKHKTKQQGKDIGEHENLKAEGEANSSEDLVEPDGTLRQRRYYGSDGKAQEDIDYKHSDNGTHTFPHRHEWDWSKNPPRQAPSEY